MTTTIATRWAGTFEVKCNGRTVTTLYTRLNGEVETVYEETFGSAKRAAKVYEQEIKAVRRANRNA
jgi:predicted GIY-YIG superfamily endonuclease